MTNALDINKDKRPFLIVMGFLIWTAMVMGTFILNSYEHFHNKLIEFGVL